MNAKGTDTIVRAYSAMEAHELEQYAAKIADEPGGVRLVLERMSTNSLIDRVAREGVDGRWDVIFGVALTALRDPRVQQWLAPVEIPSAADLPSEARDPDGTWICPSAFVPAFCLNVDRLATRHLTPPRTWADLADPCFSGELVLPDPNYSGAGFLHITALLQSVDDDAGWALLQRVASNRPRIERSASAPCLVVASGDAAVGATVTIAGARGDGLSSRVQFVVPEDAAGVEPEAFAVRRGTPRLDAAVNALAWTLTPEAASLYATNHKVGLMPFAARYRAGLPTSLFAVDVDRAVATRDAVLHRWTGTFRGNETTTE